MGVVARRMRGRRRRPCGLLAADVLLADDVLLLLLLLLLAFVAQRAAAAVACLGAERVNRQEPRNERHDRGTAPAGRADEEPPTRWRALRQGRGTIEAVRQVHIASIQRRSIGTASVAQRLARGAVTVEMTLRGRRFESVLKRNFFCP